MERKIRVMIVDDDPLLTAAICRYLRQAGYDVTAVASSGEAAIAQAASDRPDVVLMDIHLPGKVDGIDAARHIQTIDNIPVIYLTAHGDAESVTRAKATSPFGYVLKPARPKELDIAIAMALEKHRLEDELRQSNQRLEAEIVERQHAEAAFQEALHAAQQQRREMEALLKSARSILEIGDFPAVAREIFEACKALIGATAGYVALLSGDGAENAVLFLDAGGLPCTVDPDLPMPIRGLRAEAYRELRAVYDNDFARSPWQQFMPAGHVALDNVLFAPLVLEKKGVGLIGLANKASGFCEHDVDLAAAFGELASIALFNSQSLEQLERSETRFRELFQNMSSGVAVYQAVDDGRDFLFTDFNQAGENIEHLARAELVGRSVLDAFPAVRQVGLFTVFQRVWQTGRPESVPVILYQDGRTVGWRENFVYKLPSGEIVAVYNDVTAQKHAEEELRKHREQLEELVDARTGELQDANRQLAREIEERNRVEAELRQAKAQADAANRAKSEFLANMSHDIRTPMNAIMGFSEILKDHLRDVPQYCGYLDRIIGSSRNLLRLINDILDLSKIEAGHLDLQPKPTNLRQLANDVRQSFLLPAQGKGLTLTLELSPALPAWVMLDADRLNQILMNLVGNAVKFTEQGQVALRIFDLKSEISEEAEALQSQISNQKSQIRFEIADTGVGIEPHEVERIFAPFHQAESHARQFGGTGLGLTITRRLVTMMGGTITVASTPQKGSVFCVTLPDVSVISAGDAETEARAQAAAPTLLRFEAATVLIAEDDTMNREMLRAYLDTYPFHILEAVNGQEAVDLAIQACPALILMDIHMPVLDGYKAARAIKSIERCQPIPLVALTAYAMDVQRQQFQDAFDAYLSKPIARRDLLDVLARFLPYTIISGESAAESPEHAEQVWDAELARLAPLSEAALAAVRAALLPRYRKVSAVLSIDEVYDFAETVAAVGRTWQLAPFEAYALELQAASQIFDVERMKALLKRFQTMLNALGVSSSC